MRSNLTCLMAIVPLMGAVTFAAQPVMLSTAATPAALAASSVVGGASRAGLAENVAHLVAPPDQEVVVYVAPPSQDVAFTVAAANAAQVGAVVLEAPGSYNSTAFKRTLSQWTVGGVRFVGPTGIYPESFIDEIRVEYPVDTSRIGVNVMSWSNVAARPGEASALVLAHNNVSGSVTLGSAAASQAGLPLLVIDNASDADAAAALLNDDAVTEIVLAGNDEVLPESLAIAERTFDKTRAYDSTPASANELKASFDSISRGLDARRIVVATDARTATRSLAGLYAKAVGAVMAPGNESADASTTAARYLTLIGPRNSGVSVLGTSATTSLRDKYIAHTRQKTASAPAFRTVGTTLGQGQHTVRTQPHIALMMPAVL